MSLIEYNSEFIIEPRDSILYSVFQKSTKNVFKLLNALQSETKTNVKNLQLNSRN